MINLYSDPINQLFEEIKRFINTDHFQIFLLPFSGSQRRYYRISLTDGTSFIACHNDDIKENRAFIHFTLTFRKFSLPVPNILHVSKDEKIYFQSDLGDTTLFQWIRQNNLDQNAIKDLIWQALSDLFCFQTCPDIPYEYAYPIAEFDEQSIRWDLNYFKYLFLKLAHITFDEYELEKEFSSWIREINKLPRHYFMYRDFQSRNIMLHEDQFYYIDYQGGRRGNLLYDVASLLYDAKLNLTEYQRQELCELYAKKLESKGLLSKKDFFHYFPYVALTRIMQAFGAYGFRGLYERKIHFIESIQFAAQNLTHFIETPFLKKNFPSLQNVFQEIIDKYVHSYSEKSEKPDKLQVKIFSFSLKKGYPLPHPEHGGGFVFDCRSLPNPGQIPELEKYTGADEPVIEYLQQIPEVTDFIHYAYDMLSHAVSNYLSRGFTYLSAGFGCTGGKHRSVYCASVMAKKLKDSFQDKIQIKLHHVELSSQQDF
ncbi:MAG: phosphotransferase [Bacteroidales bacterium]|nr:phosphotransferase [Bacteroidales bacterium]